MKLPDVPACPWPLDHTKSYQVTAWRAGAVRNRVVSPAWRARGKAVSMFRILNPNVTDEVQWTRQGDEMKISFARPWIETDTVVYLAPLATNGNGRK